MKNVQLVMFILYILYICSNSGLGCVFISKNIYLFYSNLVLFYWEGGCMY